MKVKELIKDLQCYSGNCEVYVGELDNAGWDTDIIDLALTSNVNGSVKIFVEDRT